MKSVKFKVKNIVIMPILLILIGMNCMSFSASADWEKEDGKTYYTDESGEKVTGWQTIDGEKYYFSSDGTMRTGWLKMKSGKKYYLKKDGSMVTGWAKIKNLKYYFDKNGVMATGTKKLGQKIYEFADDGVMIGQYKDCFVELDNKYYAVDKDGNLKKNSVADCIFPDGTSREFYIGKNGYAISTEKKIDGITYVYDEKEGLLEWYYPVEIYYRTIYGEDGYLMTESGMPKDAKGNVGFGYFSAKCKPSYTGYKVEFSAKVKNGMNKIISFSTSAKFYNSKGNAVDERSIFYISDIEPGETYEVDKTLYFDDIISKIMIMEGHASYVGEAKR